MLNLMVLHWGTVTQTINLNCTKFRGSFKNTYSRGAVCMEYGHTFDIIPTTNQVQLNDGYTVN